MPKVMRENLVLSLESPGIICLLQSQCSPTRTAIFITAAVEPRVMVYVIKRTASASRDLLLLSASVPDPPLLSIRGNQTLAFLIPSLVLFLPHLEHCFIFHHFSFVCCKIICPRGPQLCATFLLYSLCSGQQLRKACSGSQCPGSSGGLAVEGLKLGSLSLNQGASEVSHSPSLYEPRHTGRLSDCPGSHVAQEQKQRPD